MESLLFQANTANLMLPIDAATFERFLKTLQSPKYRDIQLRPYMPDQPEQVFECEYFASGISFPDVIRRKFFSTNGKSAVLQLVNNALVLCTPSREFYIEPPPTNQVIVEILPSHCRKTRRGIETLFNLGILGEISLLEVSDRGDIFLLDPYNKCWFFSVSSAAQQFESMNYELEEAENDVFMTEAHSQPFQHISAAFLPLERFQSGANALMLCCCNVAGGVAQADILLVGFGDGAVIEKKARKTFRVEDRLIETCVTAISPLGQLFFYASGLLAVCSVCFDQETDCEHTNSYIDVERIAGGSGRLGPPAKISFSTDAMYAALLFEECVFVASALVQVPFCAVVRVDNHTNLPVDCQFFSARNFAVRVHGNIIEYCINTPADCNQLINCGERFARKTMLVNCHQQFSKQLLEITQTADISNGIGDAFVLAYLDFMDAFAIQLQRIVAPCLLGQSSGVFQAASQKIMTLSREDQYICNLSQNALVAISGYLFSGCRCENGTFSQRRLRMLAEIPRGYLSKIVCQHVFDRLSAYICGNFGFAFYKNVLSGYSAAAEMDYEEYYQIYCYIVTVQAVCSKALGQSYHLLPYAMAALCVALDISASNELLCRQFEALAGILGIPQLNVGISPRLPAYFMLQYSNRLQFQGVEEAIYYSVGKIDFWLDLFQKYEYMVKGASVILKELRNKTKPPLRSILEKSSSFEAFIDANLGQDVQAVYSAVVLFSQQRVVNSVQPPSELLQELILASEKADFALAEKCDYSQMLDTAISQLPVSYMVLFSTFGAALLLQSGLRQVVFSTELLISNGYEEHAFEYLRAAFGRFSEAEQRVLAHFKTCLVENVDLLTKTSQNALDDYLLNRQACQGEAVSANERGSRSAASVSMRRSEIPEYNVTKVAQSGAQTDKVVQDAIRRSLGRNMDIDPAPIINPLRNAVPERPMVFERISLNEIIGENTGSNAISTLENCRPAESADEQEVGIPKHREIPLMGQTENQILYQMPPQQYFQQRQSFNDQTKVQAEMEQTMPIFSAEVPNPGLGRQINVPLLCQDEEKPIIPVPLAAKQPSTINEESNTKGKSEASPQVEYRQVVVKRVKAPQSVVKIQIDDSLLEDIAGPEITTRPSKPSANKTARQPSTDYQHMAEVLQQISAEREQPEQCNEPSEPATNTQTQEPVNAAQRTEIDELRELLEQKPVSEAQPVAPIVPQLPIQMSRTIYAETDVIKPRPQDKYVPPCPNFDLSEHYKQLNNAASFAKDMKRYGAQGQLPAADRYSGVSSDAGDFSNLGDALRAIDEL